MGGFGGGFGRDLEALGASWVVFGALFLILVFGVVFKRALGGILAGLWLDFKGLGKGFGRFLKGIFKYSGGFWAIVVFSGLNSSHKPALQHLNTPARFARAFCPREHVIFAGAPYCLLLLSSSLSSKSVLAFACWNSF